MDFGIGDRACMREICAFIQEDFRQLVGEQFAVKSSEGEYVFYEIISPDDKDGIIKYLIYNHEKRKFEFCSPTSLLCLRFKRVGNESSELPQDLDDLLQPYADMIS